MVIKSSNKWCGMLDLRNRLHRVLLILTSLYALIVLLLPSARVMQLLGFIVLLILLVIVAYFIILLFKKDTIQSLCNLSWLFGENGKKNHVGAELFLVLTCFTYVFIIVFYPILKRDKDFGFDSTATFPMYHYFYSYSSEIVEDRTPYFSRYPIMSKDTVPRFIASRGCPYNCSFCYNEQIKNIFKDSDGKYLRYKEPENLIREILNISKRYYVESIFFVDDLFSANKKWLSQFLEIYKREIDYPFMCTTRANLLNDDLAKMLAGAGCQTISFGIETGNSLIREKVLNKKISDEQIIRCGQIARKYGMQVQTANMFCLPDERLQDAYKTIEINHKAGTHLAFTSLFLPFPNTELANYCIKNGYLKPDYSFADMPKSFLTKSMLSLDDKEKIINVQLLSFFFIRYPWLYKKFRWVVRFRILKPIFFLLYLLSNFLRHKEERGRSYISTFLYAWQFRKTI